MLECKGLYKSFGKNEIITNFSYKFEDNTIYAITGTSGKGKTTLLRMLCGLLNPDKGLVLLNGEVETQRGKKCVPGDKITFDGNSFVIEGK